MIETKEKETFEIDNIPEKEIRKAFNQGGEDRQKNKKFDACPYFLPVLQNAWASGWESVNEYLG